MNHNGALKHQLMCASVYVFVLYTDSNKICDGSVGLKFHLRKLIKLVVRCCLCYEIVI
jgi:hypothetical protein